MNPIQKAWLIALRPVISLVNDKLAKKTGILGRIGKFYSFGPRQFGFHPINRGIALLNKNLVDFMAFALHQYPILRLPSFNLGVSPEMVFTLLDPMQL